MKLMKRILAIVCTFVMIISMATGVNAVNDSSTTAATTETGKITINNVIAGEKYKAYKILTLDSYSETAKAYSYKKTNDQWAKFINERSDFFKTNENGYVTFIGTDDAGTAARRIAIYAIGFAKKNNVDATKTVDATSTSTSVVFDKLDLGYYVIESTSGTACAIATTNPNVTVDNKHSNPYVNKVIETGGKKFDNHKKNSVNLGETVTYKTTIHVKPGAKNYVLHDKMNSHLHFQCVAEVSGNDNRTFYANKNDGSSDYIVTPDVFNGTEGPKEGCTFHVEFTNKFYDTYQEEIDRGELTEIYVTYVVDVKDDAPINESMKNTTWLTYGENNTKTEKSETDTYTYGIPVFKYTGNDAGLAGAKFILSRKLDATENDALKFDPNVPSYRYTINQKTGNGTTTLESPDGGRFTIEGLEAGIYYLKETEAPKGYNKIQKSIMIEILEDGKIKVDGNPITGDVRVQNNTGSLLPSTGGMGTTLICYEMTIVKWK